MRKRVLFLTGIDPRETTDGGKQRTHIIWKGLQKSTDVIAVIPVCHSLQEERDEENKVYKVTLERRYSLGWFLQRLLARFFPELVVPFGFDRKKLLQFCEDKRIDVVVARFLGMAIRSSAWEIAPLCVDVDDTPTTNFALAYPKRRIRLAILSAWQRYYCKKARLLWVPDEDQIKDFLNNQVSYLPNIPVPPLPDFASSLGSNNTLLFVGLLSHYPNQVAIDWFLSKLWHGLKKAFPELKLEICGGGLPASQGNRWSSYPDVTLHGFVKDLRPYYQKALAILTPMRIGSGTCLKVLEALRMGRPLLSTQQGLRGIRPEFRNPQNGIFPFEDVESLVRSIRELLASDRLAVQRAAVAFVQQRNTQEFIDQTLNRDIAGVLS